jgi:hypothetical protein
MRRSFAYLLALALTAVPPPSFALAMRGSGPDGGDDATDAPVTETWRLIDGVATLEIRRETRMPGRPVGHDTIVFDRQR